MDTRADLESIEALVAAYYDAAFCGDAAALRPLFDARARIDGHFVDVPWSADLDAYLSAVAASPAPATSGAEKYYEIMIAEIVGRAAIVKLSERLGSFRFVDFLTLSRQDGGWVITHKAYHSPESLPAA
jgi:Putative lumazine-binding